MYLCDTLQTSVYKWINTKFVGKRIYYEQCPSH